MSNITFEQKVVGGLEFYVSNDGKKTGMSIRGLTRCAGVTLSTLQGVLNNVVTGSTTISQLKPFKDKVFLNSEATPTTHNAKIIASDVCAEIITYYAYESKNAANDTAKKTARTFMAIGIDNWIKQLCGYEDEPQNKEDKLTTAINVLVESVNGLRDEVEELKPIARKYQNVKEGVLVQFPGIDTIIQKLETRNAAEYLLEGDNAKLTLNQWLLSKGVTLDRSSYCKFGRMVAETFRSCKKEEPLKGNIKNRNGKWSNGVSLYEKCHFPILEMAFNQYMAS